MASRRPTLKAVATAAGVSTSTASLAFSGRGTVAPETRERIHEAAARLGYRGPDPLASSLRRGHAGVVAVIVEGRLLHAFHDPYAISVLDGLARVLDDIPTGMLLISQPIDDPAQAVTRLGSTAFDATVFLGCGARENPLLEMLTERGVPVVAMGAPRGEGVVQIDIDNRAAMAEIACHVRDLGHERVAHVALPLGADIAPGRYPIGSFRDVPWPDVADRLRGVADVFGPDVPTIVASGIDVDAGIEAAAALLDLPPEQRPTAVLAQSDLLAMGVARAAEDRGLRIPGDLSITGFDGIPLPWWHGDLTTVVQPGTGKGEAAGHALRALLAGEAAADVVLPTCVHVGTSTAPPARS